MSRSRGSRPGKFRIRIIRTARNGSSIIFSRGRALCGTKRARTSIESGDAFIFLPEEPHTFLNDGVEDLVMFLVADNPIGESAYYPDSKKWLVRSPERRLLRGEALDYFDGEE